MKLHVDLAKCVGHGRCYVLAPDLFEEDDRGHCVIRQEQVPPDQVHLLQFLGPMEESMKGWHKGISCDFL